MVAPPLSRKPALVACCGPHCTPRGGDVVRARIEAELAARGLADRIDLKDQSCFGHCREGPNVLVADPCSPAEDWLADLLPPEGVLHRGVTPDRVPALVDEALRRTSDVDMRGVGVGVDVDMDVDVDV